MNYDVFMASDTDATFEEDSSSISDDTITDIYKRIDNLDKNVNDLLILSSRKEGVNPDSRTNSANDSGSTPTDVYLASITDACQNIKENTYNTYSWVIILSFIIVIFEFKKLVRGAIKKYYTKE